MPAGTITPVLPHNSQSKNVKQLAIGWTSDASGNVSEVIPLLEGVIQRVEYVPGTAGVQPTNGYNVTLLSIAGIDVLGATGATLSNTTASSSVPIDATALLPYAVAGVHTLTVSGAGNAKSGTVYIYYR
jgi:hypothetical protein